MDNMLTNGSKTDKELERGKQMVTWKTEILDPGTSIITKSNEIIHTL